MTQGRLKRVISQGPNFLVIRITVFRWRLAARCAGATAVLGITKRSSARRGPFFHLFQFIFISGSERELVPLPGGRQGNPVLCTTGERFLRGPFQISLFQGPSFTVSGVEELVPAWRQTGESSPGKRKVCKQGLFFTFQFILPSSVFGELVYWVIGGRQGIDSPGTDGSSAKRAFHFIFQFIFYRLQVSLCWFLPGGRQNPVLGTTTRSSAKAFSFSFFSIHLLTVFGWRLD